MIILIPDCNGEVTVESAQTIRAILLIQMQDDFRVTMRSKLVTFSFQVSAQLNVIENLAVENNPQRFVFVGDGLLPARQINNAQSRIA